MGRYYHGDIEGKFWFGIQSSNSADRFGYIGESNYIDYYFDEDHISGIEDELEDILEYLGDNFQKLEEFFNSNFGYTDEKLAQFLGIDNPLSVRSLLSQYADYHLGKKILDKIKETGYCSFHAEL